jgi:hypothetical protein
MTQPIERRKTADLKLHSRFEELFGRPSPEHLRALASTMKDGGQGATIKVMPNGVILSGVDWFLAALYDGQEEVEVWVYYILEGDGEDAALPQLAEDYLRRQDVSLLARIQTHRRVKEVILGKPYDQWTSLDRSGYLHDIFANVGFSSRTVTRHLRIASLPQAIEDAFTRQAITLGQTVKIAALPVSSREAVASALRAGRPAGEVVAEFLPRGSGKHKNPKKAFEAFVRVLRRGLDDLEGRTDQVGVIDREEAGVLGRGQSLCQALLARAPRGLPPGPPELRGGDVAR